MEDNQATETTPPSTADGDNPAGISNSREFKRERLAMIFDDNDGNSTRPEHGY